MYLHFFVNFIFPKNDANRTDAIVHTYQITFLKNRLFLTPTQKCFDLPNKLVVFHFMIFHLSNVFIKYAIKLF